MQLHAAAPQPNAVVWRERLRTVATSCVVAGGRLSRVASSLCALCVRVLLLHHVRIGGGVVSRDYDCVVCSEWFVFVRVAEEISLR